MNRLADKPWRREGSHEQRARIFVEVTNEALDEQDRESERRWLAAYAQLDPNEDAQREAHPTHLAYVEEEGAKLIRGMQRGEIATVIADLKKKKDVQKNIEALVKLTVDDEHRRFAALLMFAREKGNKSGKPRRAKSTVSFPHDLRDTARVREAVAIYRASPFRDGMKAEAVREAIGIYHRIQALWKAAGVGTSTFLSTAAEIAADRHFRLQAQAMRELYPDGPPTPAVDPSEFLKLMENFLKKGDQGGRAKS